MNRKTAHPKKQPVDFSQLAGNNEQEQTKQGWGKILYFPSVMPKPQEDRFQEMLEDFLKEMGYIS